MKKSSTLTVTDQFCGAGGSSQGVRNASKNIKGLEVKLAMNHWKLAIETHNTNFPDTAHDCTDISAADPRRYFPTNILITSPECTNHSLAKGQKQLKNQMDMFATGKLDAAAERSRATMWDVPRFAEYHKYEIVIVENVVDARKWVMFDAWLMAMHSLGYNHKCVYLNSMFCHPTPQSRDRMYVVFWKKGNPAPNLNHTPTAYCPKCVQDVAAIQRWKRPDVNWGKYKQQYVYACPSCATTVTPYYYAAFNCIDWTDIGTRIGDRVKPLSENTVTRIKYGLDKYGEPMVISARYTKGVGVKSAMDAMPTQPSAVAQGIATPFVVNDQHSTGIDFRVNSVQDKIPTIASQHNLKLIVPFLIKGEHMNAEVGSYVKPVTGPSQTQTVRQSMSLVTHPFIFPTCYGKEARGIVKDITSPLGTQTTYGSSAMVCPPLIVNNKGQSMSKSAMEPVDTQTTNNHLGLVTPEAWNSFIHYNRKQPVTGINEPIQTVSTVEQNSIVSYQKPKIEDCYYRMLKPHEIQAAMAFDSDYTVLGNSRDKVKQLGNAVTPPAMEWLVTQCVKSLM